MPSAVFTAAKNLLSELKDFRGVTNAASSFATSPSFRTPCLPSHLSHSGVTYALNDWGMIHPLYGWSGQYWGMVQSQYGMVIPGQTSCMACSNSYR
jgi:hypothetical protein